MTRCSVPTRTVRAGPSLAHRTPTSKIRNGEYVSMSRNCAMLTAVSGPVTGMRIMYVSLLFWMSVRATLSSCIVCWARQMMFSMKARSWAGMCRNTWSGTRRRMTAAMFFSRLMEPTPDMLCVRA